MAATDAAGPVCHAATVGPAETPKMFCNDVFPLTATFDFAADEVGSSGNCEEDNLGGRCGAEPRELETVRGGAATTWIFVSARAPDEVHGVILWLSETGRNADPGDEMV